MVGQVLKSLITQAKHAENLGNQHMIRIDFIFQVRKRYAPNVFAAASIYAIIFSKLTLMSELIFALDALSQSEQ